MLGVVVLLVNIAFGFEGLGGNVWEVRRYIRCGLQGFVRAQK